MDFETIYETYYRRVYHFLLALGRDAALAEELTQETFFRALPALPGFRGTCKLEVWLFQIAKNLYFSHRRREARTLPISVQGEEDLAERLDRKETAARVHRELCRLSEPYKEVFTLRVFGELSYTEIAALFRKSESWARVVYHRAKGKLLQRLERRENG